jgi:lipoyl(octanoyl) transferase
MRIGSTGAFELSRRARARKEQCGIKVVILKWLGRVDYEPTLQAMRAFTDTRDATTQDEIWFLEHSPVFTLGMNGKQEHLLGTGNIPVVNTERGGQVTYHGPGQLVVYPLLDLRRNSLGVRDLVTALEESIVATVKEWGITAVARRDAPGVYVDGRKLASVGLRIRRGCSYHGLAFNIQMDLEPFLRINPCGYAGLEVTQLSKLGGAGDVFVVAQKLAPHLLRTLGIHSDATIVPAQATTHKTTNTFSHDVSSR